MRQQDMATYCHFGPRNVEQSLVFTGVCREFLNIDSLCIRNALTALYMSRWRPIAVLSPCVQLVK
jgi:hypothetical protein